MDKKNYLKNKMINLFSVNTRDRSIFTKLNSNDIFIPQIFYDDKSLDHLFDKHAIAKLSNKNNWNKIEAGLANIKNYDDFVKFINKKLIFVPKNKLNILAKSFTDTKLQEVNEYIKFKFESLDRKLINLDTWAKNKENDLGDWCLFLGRYFIIGSLKNKEVVKAPIFFKEVRINVKDSSLSSQYENIQINEKLMVYLIKQEKKNASILKEWNEITNIKDAIIFLNDNFNYDLKIPKNKTIFSNSDVEETKIEYKNKLVLEDTYIFGFFQYKGGKLKQDLENIIKLKSDVFGDKLKTQIINSKEIILDENIDWIQISSLNLSQLLALNLSLQSNTIIHGPPGTGKSETISNIIANIMYKNKTALIVSEKKAALDVLLSRLGPLKIFGLFFQDTKVVRDKEAFFDNIRVIGDLYENYEIKNDDFNYSENSFKSLINEKILLNDCYKILARIKSWNLNSFDYNDYLRARFYIITNNSLEKIKEFKLNKLTKSDFFHLTSYSLFLLKNNMMTFELAHENQIKMRNLFIKFEIRINELGSHWNNLSKLDIKKLSIIEIIKIENSQEEIKLIFQENNYMLQLFTKDIFIYKKLESKFKDLLDFSKSLNIDEGILFRILKNNIFVELNKVINNARSFEKKYVISDWINEDKIKEKRFTKNHVSEWKKIMILIQKISEENVDFNDFLFYIQNKEALAPINVFFYLNNFIFPKNLTIFIENEWLNFDAKIPIVIYENNINYEKAQLANTVFEFEDKYLHFENLKLIDKYLSINEFIYSKPELNWDKIIHEIYQKLIINLKNKINNSINKSDILEMFRISNLKRFPKVKGFIKKYFNSLLDIFPIWISRPGDVSDIIDFQEKIYDYGVFDEASQMFLERAYPSLYRTNIKIVAGDDKQLKPSSFFNKRYEDEEDEEDDNDDDDEINHIKYEDLDSLLLRSIASKWNEILLNNHYRSASQDLINFSNKNIYNNSLNVASFNKNFNQKSFEVINVNGLFINRKNNEEAIKALELIKQNLFLYKKILVITFSETQAELITNKILSSKNEEMILKLTDLDLIITNLENVQGNEGDLVILSVAYGKPSQDQKMRNFFGPLNMNGGKNRLNVGITRAKDKMIVLKSFTAKDMSISESNINAKLFKDFILYCDNIFANIESEKSSLPLVTEFEVIVYDEIDKIILDVSNLILISKYKIGTKRIDLAIFDIKVNKILLGIEMHKWNDDKKEILEEFDNQSFIKKRGYVIMNIFEIDWWKNNKKIINDITKFIKN